MDNNLLQLWFILGVVLFIIDLMSLTIVLLFASLAALSVGLAIYLDLISQTDLQPQLITFFASYVFWGVVLYLPLKNLKTKLKNNGGYHDMIGSEASVEKDVASDAKDFQVKWSGTIMQARLDEEYKNTSLKKGELVEIVSVTGAKLKVKPKK